MTRHLIRRSFAPTTYTAQPAIVGPTLVCSRCKRVYAYPQPEAAAIHCECGWAYENRGGTIVEAFRTRIGV